jgi:hypothetical protein
MAEDKKKKTTITGIPKSRMARDFIPQDTVKVNPLMPGYKPPVLEKPDTTDGQARRGRGANRVIEAIKRRVTPRKRREQ